MTHDNDNSNDRLHGYTPDQHGIITNPGKFEGEYMDAPYWWEQSLLGADDEYDGVALIKVTDDDRAAWPELSADVFGVLVTESDQGFVRVYHLSADEYSTYVERYEAEASVLNSDGIVHYIGTANGRQACDGYKADAPVAIIGSTDWARVTCEDCKELREADVRR